VRRRLPTVRGDSLGDGRGLLRAPRGTGSAARTTGDCGTLALRTGAMTGVTGVVLTGPTTAE